LPVKSEIIAAKLVSIGRCVDRIVANTPESAEQLAADHDRQDIISVNLQRAVQLAVDAAGAVIAARQAAPPDTMAESFRILVRERVLDGALAERLARAVGFRNVSVHEYDEIDWNIVYSIITRHLDDFRGFVKAISGLNA
jgi:uncharacterized protein YutE (UPF0331/DUF86 family)